MLTSLHWLNRYLDPAGVSADEAEHVLTHVGFPIESREDLPGGDVRLDVELTSNRGDCLCHVGLAREVAAATGRRLTPPALKAQPPQRGTHGAAASFTSVENRVASAGCPRFTARVIRDVKVGPSPKWLREALESVGQRSINNVVDVSNFVLLEMGHPSHTFDLNTLRGKRLIVRPANKGELLTALDGRKHTLAPDELVVADAERAVSLAGVIGGLETGVTDKTTDVLLELATWDPVLVRRAARRLDIRTDASHRFERIVDARDIDAASQRCAELIVEVAGGELLEGLIDEGRPILDRTIIQMRSARCRRILGIDVPTVDMVRVLTAMGIEVAVERHVSEERLRCVIPPHRHDLTREIDIIEEVARLVGFEKIKVAPSLDVNLEMKHPPEWTLRERAMSELSRVLTGMGFFETVTFSFIAKTQAEPFCPKGLRLLKVDEERRKGAPYLRPSVIPSLLTCRKANQDGQVRQAGGVRLFETASVFAEHDDGKAFARKTIENRNLALLADAPPIPGASKAEARQAAVRLVRGAIEGVARALGGPDVRLDFESAEPFMPALSGETVSAIKLRAAHIGYLTTITGATLKQWDLDEPVVAAEVNLAALLALYPPKARAHALPKFPAIERDLSLVVDESVEWSAFERALAAAAPKWFEGHRFAGVFRGKQIGAGKKSVTLTLVFRDPERTLRHEEVDGEVQRVVAALCRDLRAELRGPVAAPA
jgi:phenylalanyl-tRNA synthetase beta chain